LLLAAFRLVLLEPLRKRRSGEKDERYQRTAAGWLFGAERRMVMRMFDFNASAGLYFGRPGVHARKMTGYRRFASASAAVLFAVEQLAPAQLDHALLEVEEDRFNAAEIRLLYESADFPLARKGAR
jgi:hypothetical protein